MTVEEYAGLSEGEVCEATLLEGIIGSKISFKGYNWAEKLMTEDAEVVAQYGSGMYIGKPSLP